MQKYKVIIVEDEPIAAEILEDYISQVPYLQLEEICKDAIFALEVLNKKDIDLIFLDIQLPRLKGIDFLKSLKVRPQIVLTTAYHQYAVEAFTHEVLDYLLKPIEFSRFLQAVEKFKNLQTQIRLVKPESREYIFFNVNKKNVKIYLDDILYIESLKEYVRIFTVSKSIVTKFQLGQIDQLLANPSFVRIHKSYIIAKNKIDAFTATDVEVQGKVIPIGRAYKDDVMKMLK